MIKSLYAVYLPVIEDEIYQLKLIKYNAVLLAKSRTLESVKRVNIFFLFAICV